MKCYFLVILILQCFLFKIITSSSPIELKENITSGDRNEPEPQDQSSQNTSLARLLQQNSEFIGQDLLCNLLVSRFFNRGGIRSREPAMKEMRGDSQTNDPWKNEEIEELSPVKINDESKYISGSYEPHEGIEQSDEIAGDSAGYLKNIPKLHGKALPCISSKKPGILRSKKKNKPASKMHSDLKDGYEKKIDNTCSDDKDVIMLLDATNNSSQIDPLYVIIQSKNGNFTPDLTSKIHNTRTKLFDLISKMECHKISTESSSTVMGDDGCEPLHTTKSIQHAADVKCEDDTQEITEKTPTTTMKCHKLPMAVDQGYNSTNSHNLTATNKPTPLGSIGCEGEDIELRPMIMRVYVPLSVELEPLQISGRKQYVIKSISIDNSNDYKSVFANDQYDKLIK